MSTTSGTASAWQCAPDDYLKKRPAEYGVPSVPASQYVEMQDGCRLAVDVYLPAGAAPGSRFATIVIFTPYMRRFRCTAPGAEASPNTAIYREMFVPRGYALVVVDVRGTGASFGRRWALRSPLERTDALAIAEWIVAQPWSNGVIGSTGISYLGAAAAFLASTGHPGVKAVAPLFAVSDIYSEQLFPGGLLSRVWSTSYDALMLALDRANRQEVASFAYFSDPRLDGPSPVDADATGELLRQAIAEHSDNFRLHDLMPEWAFREEGPLHDPALSTDVCSPFHYLKDGARPGIPIYSVSGWYDGGGYPNGAITRWLTMAGPHDRLLLGPWDHGARTNVSPWRSEQKVTFAVLGEVLRFFDEHLLGMETGIAQEDPVHYYSIHAERWHGSSQWPPVGNTLFHLHGDRTLSEQAATTEAVCDLQVRFADTTGQRSRWERLGGQVVEQYYPDWTGHVGGGLDFTTSPFGEATEFTGHAVVRLQFRSSEPDAAVFAYLSEITEDGAIHYMTEGMQRALHRKVAPCPREYVTTWPFHSFTRSDAKLLVPGEREELVFALLPVSWTIMKGSRLRLTLKGADADHFPQVPHGRPPLLGFFAGGERGCSLELPIRRVKTQAGPAAVGTPTSFKAPSA